MKKLLLSALVLSAVFISCKKKENKIEQPMSNAPVENVNDAPDSVAEDTGNSSAITFKYAEADQFAKEYQNFVNDYKVATANKDSEALKTLGTKLNDFQKRAVELAKRVPQEEAVAFQNFVTKLETEIK